MALADRLSAFLRLNGWYVAAARTGVGRVRKFTRTHQAARKLPLADLASRPILLKKSISAGDQKILARIQREARVDVGDHKQSLVSHPNAS